MSSVKSGARLKSVRRIAKRQRILDDDADYVER
jgi:hypothetical protein